MTEAAASPDLQSPSHSEPVDPRAGLSHVQRTDAKRLLREYDQYLQEDRQRREEQVTKWNRLKNTWNNMFFGGTDAFEAQLIHVVVGLGWMGGLVYGAVNDSRQRLRQFHQQYDEFVAAGLLKEKWQLHKVAVFRTVKDGVRMGLICATVPLCLSAGILSSLSYRNDVHWFDFGVLFSASSAAFNIKKTSSIILRQSAMAFAVGAGIALVSRAWIWWHWGSLSEYRYYAVYGRTRSNEMMSRKSWEVYKTIPQYKELYERELDMQESWKRYREELKRRDEEKDSERGNETKTGPREGTKYKLVLH